MKNEITVTQPNAIRIADAGENSTKYGILPSSAIILPKIHVDTRRIEARNILDKLSVSYNPMGIEGVLAALIIEVFGNENYGVNNK